MSEKGGKKTELTNTKHQQNCRQRQPLHPPRPKAQTARGTSLSRTRRTVRDRGKRRPHLRESLRRTGGHASSVPAATTPIPGPTAPLPTTAPPARAAAAAAAASQPAGSGRAGCAAGFATCGAKAGEGLLCCYVRGFGILYHCDFLWTGQDSDTTMRRCRLLKGPSGCFVIPRFYCDALVRIYAWDTVTYLSHVLCFYSRKYGWDNHLKNHSPCRLVVSRVNMYIQNREGKKKDRVYPTRTRINMLRPHSVRPLSLGEKQKKKKKNVRYVICRPAYPTASPRSFYP